ncbi:LCP family protein [Bacillus sp. CGMCC 1.16607]|uniref:LCP family protein n=1 Tax=Bacillus sp. CGMCC 1.16607 TaxID=3351842 RepID=UPI003637AD02
MMFKLFSIFILLLLTSCAQFFPEDNEGKTPTQSVLPEQQKNQIKLRFSDAKNIQNEDLSRLKKEQNQAKQMKKMKKNDEGTINFLLLGSDTRGEKVSRADSMIVAQYDSKHRNIKLVSLMRDCYVEIPNYSKKYNKLNLAYFLGGTELLKETIKKNFDISIDHTVIIDFQGFVKIIDTLAPEGIPVHVKQDIVNDMRLNLKPGVNSLHGKELLSYVRYRHDGESDFGRVRRQQEVLTLLKDTLQNRLVSFEGFTKMPSLVSDSFEHLDTDIPLEKMLSISSKMLLNPIDKVETLRIPVKDGYVNEQYEHSGAVLKLDMPKNREVLKDFLSEPEPVNN